MPGPHPGFHGKKGRSGRKSVAVEFAAAKWLMAAFKDGTDVSELEALIATKKYSVSDVMKLKMLKGNDRLLNATMNKLVPDLHEIGGTGGGPIEISWKKPEDADHRDTV
jgi:hypothetical protein